LLISSSDGAYFRQVSGHIRQPMGDYMDDLALALKPSADTEHAGGKDNAALLLID
jgi:hypothetical protein